MARLGQVGDYIPLQRLESILRCNLPAGSNHEPGLSIRAGLRVGGPLNEKGGAYVPTLNGHPYMADHSRRL